MASKKRRSFFDSFFDDFPDFGEIDKMFDAMMRDAGRIKTEPGKPLVYGFSMHVGPDGKPHVEQFGNVEVPKGKMKDEREPLVDVIDAEKEVTVVAELPGVTKEEVHLRFAGGTLVIDVKDPERRYYKEVALPAQVDEDSVKATLKNGILEVKMAKKRAAKAQAKAIKVEG
jgi:HSP20 family protein